MHALIQGSISDWVDRFSKILLLLAGLTVLIDLIGPDRFNRWADNASIQRNNAAKRLQDLHAGRPLCSLVIKMTRRVANGRIPPRKIRGLDSPWFTHEEFAEFARRARKKLNKENDWNEDIWGWQIAYAEASKFLSSRLTLEQRRLLREAGDLPLATRRLTRVPSKALTYFRVTALIFWALFYLLARPLLGPSLGIETALTAGGLGAILIALAFRIDWISAFTLIVIRFIMAVRFRLARGALALIGPRKDGRRLRLAALIAFIVGSLLDLVVTW